MKNPFKTKKPIKHKYHVKNIFLFSFLKSIDALSWVYFKIFKKKNFDQNLLKNPKKILLSNIAHLGDVLISTSVIPILKQNYPNVKIGFVCSKTSKQIIENNPNIDKIYTLDHWYLNRSRKTFFKKLIHYYKTRKIAINQIKKDNYDLAIDLYYYFPNTIYLLHNAKIPIKIGYSSGGFKNFLNKSLPWIEQNKHVSFYLFDLLKILSINLGSMPIVKFELPLLKKEDQSQPKYQEIIKNLPDEYFLFHIGAGSDKKMWPSSKWRELAQKVTKEKKMKILFTGRGENESNIINQIIEDQTGIKDQISLINLSDKLDLSSLIEIIKKAKVVVCVDSLVLHLATALNIPTIVLCSNTNNPHHWVLKRENIIPIIKNSHPNTNYKKNMFKTYSALNKIEVKEVLNQMDSLIWKN